MNFLLTTHELEMDSVMSRPHHAVHTGAHISLLRCTSQASTRVVKNKQEDLDLGSSPRVQVQNCFHSRIHRVFETGLDMQSYGIHVDVE